MRQQPTKQAHDEKTNSGLCSVLKDGDVIGGSWSGGGPEAMWKKMILHCPSGEIENVPYTKEEQAKIREDRVRAEQHRQDLIWALRTRVLTKEEMDEVRSRGVSLIIIPLVSYNERDKQQEFNDLLFQQLRIRLAALDHAREDR